MNIFFYTHMRLLGGILRPSLNQVTCGWGKLRMRGAGITAPSPWETDWVRSPSSKLPITTGKQTNNIHRKGCHKGKGVCKVAGTHFSFLSCIWLLVPLSFCHVLPVLKYYIEPLRRTVPCCCHGFHSTSGKARRNQEEMTHRGTQRGR